MLARLAQGERKSRRNLEPGCHESPAQSGCVRKALPQTAPALVSRASDRSGMQAEALPPGESDRTSTSGRTGAATERRAAHTLRSTDRRDYVPSRESGI